MGNLRDHLAPLCYESQLWKSATDACFETLGLERRFGPVCPESIAQIALLALLFTYLCTGLRGVSGQ